MFNRVGNTSKTWVADISHSDPSSKKYLPKSEQDRIAGQLARTADQLTRLDANFEEAPAVLADTLDLTRDCHAAHLEAGNSTRSLLSKPRYSSR